jgi:hypothetical protein
MTIFIFKNNNLDVSRLCPELEKVSWLDRDTWQLSQWFQWVVSDFWE